MNQIAGLVSYLAKPSVNASQDSKELIFGGGAELAALDLNTSSTQGMISQADVTAVLLKLHRSHLSLLRGETARKSIEVPSILKNNFHTNETITKYNLLCESSSVWQELL